jgi:hypothetical protein
MQPILRPFRPEDLDVLLNRDGEQIARATVLQQAALGPAMTAVVGDRPIGCAGIVIPWPGVGSAWMILADDAATHILWITKTVVAFLRAMQRLNGLHRIEALALQECVKNQRWLEMLGFQREVYGVAHGFLSDRRDMVRYEMVNGG